MALTLEVLSGNTAELVPITLDGPRIVVGRAANSDVRLPDYSVSLRHASFRQRGADYLIVDEGSTNGTFVGPVRLSPQAPRVVRSGDRLRFGRIWIEARIESIPATAQSVLAARELASRLVADALAADSDDAQVSLALNQGLDAASRLTLEQPDHRYILGRAPNADLVLKDVNASRRHVEVFRRNGQVYARDLGSKNGTSLAGLPLPSNHDTAWPGNAVLQVGSDQVTLTDPVAEALLEMDHAADAVMAPDEPVPLPNLRSAESEPQATDPNAASPKTQVRPERKRQTHNVRSGGLSHGDVHVGLIALLVLGSSLAGLYWLLGGH